MKRLLLLLALAAAPAAAQPAPPGPPLHEIIIDNAQELGLDDDTVDAIKALADARRPLAASIEAQLQTADPDQRLALVEQMHANGRALMDEIFALLDDEQVEAVQAILPPPPDELSPPPR